jgi:hypothetical protein
MPVLPLTDAKVLQVEADGERASAVPVPASNDGVVVREQYLFFERPCLRLVSGGPGIPIGLQDQLERSRPC